MKFDMPCVLEQLRYTGMLETIRIRKTGYPVRLLFGHFVDRYRYLVSTHLPRGAPNKELCRIILDKAAPKDAQAQYQLGLTRVFLRESLERTLEYNRALILERAAITVQRYSDLLKRIFILQKVKNSSKIEISKFRNLYQIFVQVTSSKILFLLELYKFILNIATLIQNIIYFL